MLTETYDIDLEKNHGIEQDQSDEISDTGQDIFDFSYSPPKSGTAIFLIPDRIQDSDLKYVVKILRHRGFVVRYRKNDKSRSLDYWRISRRGHPVRRLSSVELIKFTWNLVFR